MKTIIAGVILLCIGVACAQRRFPQRGLAARAASAGGNQPYWFLGTSRKGANSIQAVQVPLSAGDFFEDDDDGDDDYANNYEQQVVVEDDDDDSSFDDHINEDNFENDNGDEDSALTGNVVGIISLDNGNSIFSKRKDEDDIIELEEREIDNDDDDEDSGETAIFLPRAALENIPNGSILALVDDSESTGRAIRRYYRRRYKGGPRRKRRGNKQRRRRRGNNRRRRPAIRVIRPGSGGKRVSNRRRQRPNVIRLN